MFIARSAFWLTGAFLVMAPSAGMDLGNSARMAGADIVDRSAQAVVAQLNEHECDSLECTIGRQIVIGALPAAPRAALAPISDTPTPFPPQRPDWAY